MDQESSQTSSATKQPRMTLDKHLALEARVDSLDELKASMKSTLEVVPESDHPEGTGSVSRDEFDNLQEAFIKIATMSGHGNYLAEFGFKAWVPEAKDMKKYTG